MTTDQGSDLSSRVAALGRASKRAAAISLLGFVLVLGAFGYAAFQLRRLEHERSLLERRAKLLADSVAALEKRTTGLVQTQQGVLDFLGGVTGGERIRLIDSSVNWESTKADILRMETGPRKAAILAAVLLAWKELPFSLENRGLAQGLDSPHFIEAVLSSVGVKVEQRAGERLSDAMMRRFEQVESPLPGDLLFYRGNVGSFVLMYIAQGSPLGKGVVVGTLQRGEEIQVLDSKNINTPAYPFIGAFRVPYPQ